MRNDASEPGSREVSGGREPVICASGLPRDASIMRQAFRYGVVGVMNNLAGYLVYLLITWLGVDPKVTVSLLYPLSAAMGYFGHLKYSFSYRGRRAGASLRYALAHCAGYGVNVAMLYVLSDRLGFPHQAVQASAIFVVAGILFLLFRYFVFPRTARRDGPA